MSKAPSLPDPVTSDSATPDRTRRDQTSRAPGLLALAAAAMLMLPLSPANAADLAEKVHALGKIEANIWEAAAAVYFHLADDDRESQETTTTDFHDDVETVHRQMKKLEKMGLSEKEAARFARMKEHWEEVQHRAEALLAVDPGSEAAMEAEDAHFHEYWHATEKLDHEVDQFIVDLAGEH